ncbi:ABC transporter substrate-binding protein [Bacillus dakarensis]|uniref:ABC transporter substrate-binding protein n=1 Tax=Robertmurraya dakarensis TaxID=1926278 RepID=UPI000981F8B2|nr:ABC transporter substrate-binding protein [Bacillus dakarensis]
MSFKNKYFKWIAGLLMVFLLAACNSDQSSSSSSSNQSTEGGSKAQSENGAQQGVTDDEIKVGLSAPQTGPLAVYDAFRKGMDSYFKYVNENGGVHGRELKLIAYDDQYQPAKAVPFARRLAEDDKVFLVAGNMGTAALQATRDIFIDNGVPMLMSGSGISDFIKPPVKGWYGSSMINYEVEAQIMLDYAINNLGAKKIAVAYQNDDFGKTPLNALKEALKKYPDVELVAEVTYLPQDTEFSSQAQKIDQANPDTLFNFGVMAPAVNLKKALYKIGRDDLNYIVCSVAGGDTNAFELAGEGVWDGTYSGGVMASIDDDSNEKIKLFKERFKKEYGSDPITGFAQSGWAVAQVVVEALDRTGEDLTWDKFNEAIYTFDNWEDSMYTSISFSENNHYGITKMFMTKAEDGKLVQVTD